jgi:hypothetical protein
LTYELYQRINRGYGIWLKLRDGPPSLRWEQMASAFFTALPNLDELCLGRQVDFRALVFRPIRNPDPEEEKESHSPENPEDKEDRDEQDNNAKQDQNDQDNAAVEEEQPAENTEEVKEEEDPNLPPPPPQVQHEIIRSYLDRPLERRRLDFPPARWTGDGCTWWSAAGRVPDNADMGVPDEKPGEVKYFGPDTHRERSGSVMRLNYQQMVMDHCETVCLSILSSLNPYGV